MRSVYQALLRLSRAPGTRLTMEVPQKVCWPRSHFQLILERVYSLCSLVPRPRPVFRRFLYGKLGQAGEGLVSFFT